MPRDDETDAERQAPGARPKEERLVGGQGILFGPFRRPPQVRAGHQAVVGPHQCGDVLPRVTGGLQQLHRRRHRVPLRRPIDPDVVLVDRPVIVKPGVGEESGVQGVIRMMVAEDHVGDGGRADAQGRERLEDDVTTRRHAGVDDDIGLGIPDEHHGARDTVVRVTDRHDVKLRSHVSAIVTLDPLSPSWRSVPPTRSVSLGHTNGIVPGYEGGSHACRRQPLQATDRLNRGLGRHVDPPTDRELVLDVLRQVRGVEGEDETAAPDRLVEVDDEALMSRRVPGGEHRGDTGRDLASPSARRQSMEGSS